MEASIKEIFYGNEEAMIRRRRHTNDYVETLMRELEEEQERGLHDRYIKRLETEIALATSLREYTSQEKGG